MKLLKNILISITFLTVLAGKDNDGQNVKFIINSNGSNQHSYGTTYKEDGQDLIVVDEVLGKEYKDSEGNAQTGTAKYVEDGQYKYGFKSGVENKVSDVDLTKFYNEVDLINLN